MVHRPDKHKAFLPSKLLAIITPMKHYEKELQVAVQAVQHAAKVCQTVQQQLVTASTLEKKDKSPVTVADFASQAVVCQALRGVFTDDPIVGEEDAAELREAEARATREQVVAHVQSIHANATEAEVLDWIDLGGTGEGGREGRFWTLDPIDGTKGFLRGQQYAIALALIEDGKVVLGVLGCPNLPMAGQETPGTLMVAVRGEGTQMMALDGSAATTVTVDGIDDPAQAVMCESVESGHTDQGASAGIVQQLGTTAEPFRIDSQCKYAAVARGDASIYLRLPTRPGYQEKIWDHAAGTIVLEEAGGTVTDIHGKPLDFSLGKTLANNQGVISTNGRLQESVLQVVDTVFLANR